jgi:hypothetical protein
VALVEGGGAGVGNLLGLEAERGGRHGGAWEGVGLGREGAAVSQGEGSVVKGRATLYSKAMKPGF